MNKLKFIDQFDIATKNKILHELISLGLSNEDIKRALNSRLCDLEDTININKYLI